MNSGPDRAEVKAAIRSQSEQDPELAAARLKAQRERIELDGRAAFFELRTLWSLVIIAWISVFIVFHIVVTFMVGLGSLNFTSHKWLIPLIVVENFLQVVGMGFIVVRFFHPGHSGKTE